MAGGQGNGVGYLLDGTIFQDPYNNLSLPLPFPDALQEFKVETSALPAQYGYHSTATVNAVTKSGTNEYHGDLFEFLRNGDLNARDFFRGERAISMKRNQFGGVIGGRDHQRQAVLLRRLPANVAAFRSGGSDVLRADGGHATGQLHDLRRAGFGGRLPDQTVQPE